MSLITLGFYSGLLVVTELRDFKINLLEREIIRLKNISFERKFIFFEKELLLFKIRESENFTLKKEMEFVKWKIL